MCGGHVRVAGAFGCVSFHSIEVGGHTASSFSSSGAEGACEVTVIKQTFTVKQEPSSKALWKAYKQQQQTIHCEVEDSSTQSES